MASLSNQDKHRIYLEEKARRQAQKQLKKEEDREKNKKVAMGCLTFFGIIFLLILIAIATSDSSCSSRSSGYSSSNRLLSHYHSKGQFMGYKKGEGAKLSRDIAASREATRMIERGDY